MRDSDNTPIPIDHREPLEDGTNRVVSPYDDNTPIPPEHRANPESPLSAAADLRQPQQQQVRATDMDCTSVIEFGPYRPR